MTAAIYCRVSTDKQHEKGTSLESQEQRCREFAAQLNLPVAHVYRESHTAADFWERPKLNELRERIRARELTALICYAIDRLSRSIAHLMIIADECERHDVELLFVSEPMDKSPEGKLLQSVRSYVAEVERLKIRERVVRGKQQRVERGKLINASTPLYGYSQDKETSARALHPGEARVVRRIWDLAFGGTGQRSIARKLNAESVPSPASGKRVFKKPERSAQWSKTTIARILKEPAYAGISVALRWKHEKLPGKKVKITERPRSEWRILDDALTPAIVTPEEFDRMQALVASRKCGDTSRNESHFALLRGLIYCGKCGRRRMVDQDGYRCSSRSTGAGRCGSPSTPRKAIEQWAWDEALRWLRDEASMEDWLKENPASMPEEADAERLSEIEAMAAKLSNQQKKLLANFADADAETGALVAAQIKQIGSERQRLKIEVESLRRKLAAPSAAREDFLQIVQRLRDKVDAKQFKPDESIQRQYLEALSVRIEADGRDRETWRFILVFEA